ncbi:MAG TPA: family 16 glycoside hydrolase, partial [Fimbriimonadaceae bacterium]|nr:family 16 glycoside hydrolase [Fimbriimonadaceae bacterium]
APRDRRLILGKHVHDFHLLQSVPAPVTPGHWHRLRVDLRGPRIQVTVDGGAKPLIDYTDGDHPLLKGAIALRTWNADASFRDVKIDGQPASIGFTGEGVSHFWDAIGHGRCSLEGGAFSGALCQRIALAPDRRDAEISFAGIANRGLNRWGISVVAGHRMEGRVYLKARGLRGPVTVALQSADGTKTYAGAKLRAGARWSKAAFELTPNATDPKARFALWIDQPGELWVDQAVLMDAKEYRFKGLPVRRDIAEALVRERITFLRYGGSMVNANGYRWKNMIGDPDRRPPYAGTWNPCSTNGFGVFDFLNFCEAARIHCAFAINVEESPQDAVDLADYLYAPTTNEWGSRRAADGHPAPYHVDYIEIGNEEAMDGSDAGLDHYAERFRLLAAAIHSRKPDQKLVCAAWFNPDRPAMRRVFEAVDGVAAAWDLHFWCDEPNAGDAIEKELARTEAAFTGWNQKTTLKAVIFEENGGLHNLQRALGHATTLNAARRLGDFVLVDCAANCLQPWLQNDNGWDQGQVFFTPDHAWDMPPSDAQRIESSNHLPLRIESSSSGNLDVIAARSEDGKVVGLSIVNVSDQPVVASLSIVGFHAQRATTWTLSGKLDAANPPVGPKAVAPVETKIDPSRLEVPVPPHAYVQVRVEGDWEARKG